jgi:hypothetical protein
MFNGRCLSVSELLLMTPVLIVLRRCCCMGVAILWNGMEMMEMGGEVGMHDMPVVNIQSPLNSLPPPWRCQGTCFQGKNTHWPNLLAFTHTPMAAAARMCTG